MRSSGHRLAQAKGGGESETTQHADAGETCQNAKKNGAAEANNLHDEGEGRNFRTKPKREKKQKPSG